MMNVKRFSFILLAPLILSSFLLGCKGSAQNTLKDEFKDNGKNQPYAQGISLSEMNFSVFYDYFSVSGLGINYTRNLTLPCDVEYYSSKNDSSPTLTLQKGTEVYILPSDSCSFLVIGYGIQCWPDYEAGWRYGQPLMTHDFPQSAINAEHPTMYYTKTEQLFAVANEFYQNNSLTLNTITPIQFQNFRVLFIDRELYSHGAFCSPDFVNHFDPSDL